MSYNTNSVKIWLFGNFALDTKFFIKNGKHYSIKSLGGSVNFGSKTLHLFFPQATCCIFSIAIPELFLDQKSMQFGDEFPSLSMFERSNEKYLTHYILDYRESVRKLFLEHFPVEKISMPKLNKEIPHIAMITPIFDELSENLAVELKKKFSKIFIACDPQGWCRERNPETKEISIKEWKPSEEFLDAISVIKLSIEDIRTNYTHQELITFIQRIHHNNVILIITAGKNGNISFFPDHTNNLLQCYFTPISSVTNIIDTTGAGDVWLAAFSATYYMTKSIVKSLSTATIISSLKIQAEGLNFKSIDVKELDKQVLIHEKTIKQLSIDEGIEKVITK